MLFVILNVSPELGALTYDGNGCTLQQIGAGVSHVGLRLAPAGDDTFPTDNLQATGRQTNRQYMIPVKHTSVTTQSSSQRNPLTCTPSAWPAAVAPDRTDPAASRGTGTSDGPAS